MLTLDLIKEAENRIASHVIETPLVYSDFVSRKVGRRVFLKLESQQYTSSFKPRPAFNNILLNLKEKQQKGVLTSSSGNFAQAVAFASQKLNVSAQVVMIKAASPYKKERTKALGAEQRLIVEPGAAVPVAALLSEKLKNIRQKNIICIITGGNIEFKTFAEMIR